jgi:hypothetical protein
MSVARSLASVAVALSAAACGTLASDQEVPAVVVAPTAQSRDDLRQALASALNGALVVLADDALMHESLLIIERTQARDASGVPLSGRELGRPEQFRLVKSGTRCILIQVSSGKRWTLVNTQCAPT